MPSAQRRPASVLRHFLIAKLDGKPVPTLPALLLEFGVDVDDVDELVVDELLDAEAKQFAAVAGAADAAERQVGLDHRRMVDEHHSTFGVAASRIEPM